MSTIITKLALLLFFATGLSGCMVSGGLVIEPEPIIIGEPPQKVQHRKHQTRKAKKKNIKIPPGHMPPRGMCRVWFYDRPPGHQPPPVSCNRIGRNLPYGAVVIRE